jgi:hypothetical protein
MPSSLLRMIRATADRVPLIRARPRITGMPFRLTRAVIRSAGWIARTGRGAW